MRLHSLKSAVMMGLLATSCTSAWSLSGIQQTSIQPTQENVDPDSKPIRIAGGVMAANILTMAWPVYPENGCAAHASGAVVMVIVIGKDGRVKKAEAISGHPLLQQPYLDAAKRYTFKPYLLNGQAVEVQSTLVLDPSINCGETQPEQASADVPSKPLRVSGGVIAGNLLTKVQPIFPPEARAAHVNGIVVMHVVIGKDGKIRSIEAISGPDLLRPAFVDAVKQWVYRPYLLNGNPVEVETTVSIAMQMNGGS